MDYKGQVGIITGGTRGIGAAIAEALAQRGVNVVIASRNAEEANEKAAKLSPLGIKAMGVKLDVSKSDEVGAVFEKLISGFKNHDHQVRRVYQKRCKNVSIPPCRSA